MPKLPASHNRTPTEATAAENLRTAARNGDLDDHDTTEVLAEVDTSRPLQMRNGEHGHIDGPRGLQDFHTHDDGDKEHGHKRGPLLHRTASVTEYVPPLAATDPPGADQTTDPTPARVPDAMGASESAPAPPSTRGGSDTAGSGRSTALEPAYVPSRERLAAVERKIRARLREAQMLIDLQDLLDGGANQLDMGDLVGAETIRQLKGNVDRWAQGRGVR